MLMKAMIYEQYGSPEGLRIKEMERPSPKDHEVLVKVSATTVTSGDVRMRKADPFGVRLYNGLTRPKRFTVLGSEFAGTVTAVGKRVTQIKTGDRVFGGTGTKLGANVEYLCIAETGAVATLPESISFEDAAALPFGAATSLYFLQEKGKVRAGQNVLIYGASGALGVYAVQLAKRLRAHVTAVCGTRNMDMVKSLGADRVIDYTQSDFTKTGERYDVIYDTLGKSPFSGSLKSLEKDGIYLRAVHMELPHIIRGIWTNLSGGKKVIGGVAVLRKEQIDLIKDLLISGKLKPVVDRKFPFDKIAEAHSYVEQGRKKGAVVLTVG
jgi:NADPH:quinone reductase-like Zn-dependent oxidoreductase